MIDRLRRWFVKRNWRRTFLVHFSVHDDTFKLDEYLQELEKSYTLQVTTKTDDHNQSITVRMRPKQLYETLSKLPEKVVCSYETVKSGKLK